MVDPEGKRLVVLFLGHYPLRRALSEDDGSTWTELEPVGDFGGLVTMSGVERLARGDYLAFFHDDDRFLHAGGSATGKSTCYQTRSPDGAEILLLLRENLRVGNSFASVSKEEGASWSEPRELS